MALDQVEAGPVNELKEDISWRYNQDIRTFNLMILSLVIYQSYKGVNHRTIECKDG